MKQSFYGSAAANLVQALMNEGGAARMPTAEEHLVDLAYRCDEEEADQARALQCMARAASNALEQSKAANVFDVSVDSHRNLVQLADSALMAGVRLGNARREFWSFAKVAFGKDACDGMRNHIRSLMANS